MGWFNHQLVYGCFLKWWYPKNTPKWSFLVGKLMVVGYHHFGKPPISFVRVLDFQLGGLDDHWGGSWIRETRCSKWCGFGRDLAAVLGRIGCFICGETAKLWRNLWKVEDMIYSIMNIILFVSIRIYAPGKKYTYIYIYMCVLNGSDRFEFDSFTNLFYTCNMERSSTNLFIDSTPRWGKQHGWNMLASRSWNGSWKLPTTVGETWRVKLWGLTWKLDIGTWIPNACAFTYWRKNTSKKMTHLSRQTFFLAQVSMSVALCFSRFQNFQTPWDLKKIFKLKA